MTVGIRRYHIAVMAQPLLHLLERCPIFEQQCSTRMSKLVEATNGYSLVEAKNDIWYDIASGYGFCRSLFY